MLKFKFPVSYGIIKQVQAKTAVMASFFQIICCVWEFLDKKENSLHSGAFFRVTSR